MACPGGEQTIVMCILWYRRKNCLNQEGHGKSKEKEDKKDTKKKRNMSEDFKVTLSALLLEDDFKSIKEYF
eukprot:1453959-Ditylum_brightwellii.AAC.1